MTTVIPEIDLSTVLTEELAPPCDGTDECDKAATWAAKITNTVCGCRFTFLLCDRHKDEVQESLRDPKKNRWVCTKCGTKWGPCTYADELILELEKL